MNSPATFAMIVGTLLALSANAQDSRKSASQPQGQPSAVVARLRDEAAKVGTGKFSELFWALSERKIRAELGLSAQQDDLVGRLEKLTRDVIKAWLLRDLDATPPPPPDVLAARLSPRGDRVRASIIAHAEAMAIEGVLTSRQGRICREATGQKATRPLGRRFGRPTIYVPDEKLGTDELAELLRGRGVGRAGRVFGEILGGPRLREFLDPKTGLVPPLLVPYARPCMPAVNLARDEADAANRLDSLTVDIFDAWLTRDLEKTPPPAQAELRQRLIEHPRLMDSIFGHAEVIALEGILTPDDAELCLKAVWRKAGMEALGDAALASRLRLSKSQREEIAFLLENKSQVYDRQFEAQIPLIAPSFTNPEAKALSAQIAADGRDQMNQVDEIIWDTLTPTQFRVLGQIMSDKTQQAPRAASARKKTPRRGG
jgi:hypothetical protein